MSKQILCSLFCPMVNKFGVCESAMHRVKVNLPAGQREGTLGCEQVRECPHRHISAAIQTKKAPPEGGADDTVSSTGSAGACRDGVIGIGVPSGFVVGGSLIAPHRPTIADAAGK